MDPRKPVLLLIAALTLSVASACLPKNQAYMTPPKVDELIKRHIEVIGGRAAIDSIKSIQAVGILDERGTLHPVFSDRKRPDFLRVRMIHSGELVFTEVFDGSRSWEGPPGKETCRPGSAATAATRHAAEQFDDALLTAASRAARVSLVGKERIGGRVLYRIDIMERDGEAGSYYLDGETFMLSRVRNRRPLHPTELPKTIETVYDDYRPVSGVLMPFREIERDVETGEPLTTSIAFWIEANVPVAGNPYARASGCE